MNYGEYSKVIFLDANVVLEGKSLKDQNWQHVDASGPILLLFVPQVLKEIDSKKRDGRLGKHARDFNRLIAPAASEQRVVQLIENDPIVDVGLAVTNRVDWEKLDDLDPDEPDARAVAQVINERYTSKDKRVFLSQDINPIAMASRHGLQVVRIDDDWLRPPEPSPDQRRINKLEHRVKELEATEPQLTVAVNFGSEEPFKHLVITEPGRSDKVDLISSIIADHPRDTQGRGGMFSPAFGFDAGYDGRYDNWREAVVPSFADALAEDTSSMLAQTPVSFEITNDAAVQAEGLVVNVKIIGGTLSEKWNVVPSYPRPPVPENTMLSSLRHIDTLGDISAQNTIGRHEMYFDIEADNGSEFEVHCQDFRHGRTWLFDAILTLDHKRDEDVTIVVKMTASNMRGTRDEVFKFRHEAGPEVFAAVYDVREKRFLVERPMEDEINRSAQSRDFSRLNLVQYGEEE